MDNNYKEYLKFAKDIARTAGEIMLKYFSEENDADYKLDKTIVTKADAQINDYIIAKVKETYPTHSVDGEEKQFGTSKYVWVCDPVDGTAMYARHIPVAVFSIALVIDGVPYVGVVYDPFTNSMYTAIKGEGAFKNDIKISVSNITLTDKSSVCHYDLFYKKGENIDIADCITLLSKKSYCVSIGSVIRACMCVAAGEFTAVIFPGTTHKNCDIAAAKVIVEEAGGIVTNIYGKEQRYDEDIKGALVSNKTVHKDLVDTINKALKYTTI